MPSYVALLRGINVGGKNVISMANLADMFRTAGYDAVQTYIQSGNVLFDADADAADAADAADDADGASLEAEIETMLENELGKQILVVVRSRDQLSETIASAPETHGADDRRSDVLFLKHPDSMQAVFDQLPPLREGVDAAATGPGVIYFSRLAAQASKSRLSRLVTMPIYQKITIRNWRTSTRLLAMLDDRR